MRNTDAVLGYAAARMQNCARQQKPLAHDAAEDADAVIAFTQDRAVMERYGGVSRQLPEESFSAQLIAARIVRVYMGEAKDDLSFVEAE